MKLRHVYRVRNGGVVLDDILAVPHCLGAASKLWRQLSLRCHEPCQRFRIYLVQVILLSSGRKRGASLLQMLYPTKRCQHAFEYRFDIHDIVLLYI